MWPLKNIHVVGMERRLCCENGQRHPYCENGQKQPCCGNDADKDKDIHVYANKEIHDVDTDKDIYVTTSDHSLLFGSLCRVREIRSDEPGLPSNLMMSKELSVRAAVFVDSI
ncbi:hypothetical protein BaRGS_00007459 [Batillaria attramentaria]|uniref:Uncharacterized protein n=1 Tax=Batillaria attramentaria TaxID=370345 RepID=A0ABD0LNV8_9CAEN